MSENLPRLEGLFGQAPDLTSIFVSRPQETEESTEFNFPDDVSVKTREDLEEQMLVRVNEERAKAGVKPLVMDEELRQVAREHSEEMFQENYFAHESPVSGSPFDRMQAAGIGFMVAGENLAYAPTLSVAHEG